MVALMVTTSLMVLILMTGGGDGGESGECIHSSLVAFAQGPLRVSQYRSVLSVNESDTGVLT